MNGSQRIPTQAVSLCHTNGPFAINQIRQEEEKREDDPGGQMSFLEHLDELRTRLIRSIVFVVLAASLAWFVSGYIYSFLARPINHALAEAQQARQVTIAGLNGQLSTVPLNSLHQNDKVRYIFPELNQIGSGIDPRRRVGPGSRRQRRTRPGSLH